ncbi:hypothetical protein P9112_004748 [Eukaryota sp. TZLM1-RC]
MSVPQKRVSQKDVHNSNQHRLSLLRYLSIGFSSLYVIILFFKWSSYGYWHKFISLLYFGLNYGALKYLSFTATPVLSDAGKVQFAADISSQHLIHDVLYVCWFGQALSTVTRHSWLPLLMFPILGAWKAGKLIKDYVFTPTVEETMTEEEKAAMKKHQDRAARRRRGYRR